MSPASSGFVEKGEAGPNIMLLPRKAVELHVIADAIGRILNVLKKSLTVDETQAHFGSLSGFVSIDMPASANETRKN
ncbi:MAG TPA: hypothetical protein VHC94_09925 [Nitrobacter sp.]|nr:hypothetical protein [Nitrobacter sp.]